MSREKRTTFSAAGKGTEGAAKGEYTREEEGEDGRS